MTLLSTLLSTTLVSKTLLSACDSYIIYMSQCFTSVWLPAMGSGPLQDSADKDELMRLLKEHGGGAAVA